MNIDLDDANCAEHGLLSHVVVHEAGHAVIALRRGIPFSEVVVHSPENYLGREGLDFEAGGLRLFDEDLTRWVPSRSDDVLDLVLAGSMAEEAIYGHSLPSAYKGDIGLWRRGMGWTDPLDPALARKLIGDSRDRLHPEINEIANTVLSVARALSSSLVTDKDGRYSGFTGSFVLTSGEVEAIVAGSPDALGGQTKAPA